MEQRLKIGDVVRISEKRRNWTPEELRDTWEIFDAGTTAGHRVYRLRSITRGTICLTPNNDPGREGWVSYAYLARDEFLTAVRAAALSTNKPRTNKPKTKEKSTV